VSQLIFAIFRNYWIPKPRKSEWQSRLLSSQDNLLGFSVNRESHFHSNRFYSYGLVRTD